MKLISALCIAGMALSACSYDFFEHRDSCKGSSDCPSRQCMQNLCVPKSSSVSAPSTDAGHGTHGGDGGSGGGHGSGGHPAPSGGDAAMSMPDGSTTTHDSGSGGSGSPHDGGQAGNDSGSATRDAGQIVDSGSTTDSGSTPVVPPYAKCSGNEDCNPDEMCRMQSGNGVCSAPCTKSADCKVPSGNYDSTPLCDTDNRCRLDCAPPSVPPFPLSCPQGTACVNEISHWTCYPQ
jgi:hypothetical protein